MQSHAPNIYAITGPPTRTASRASTPGARKTTSGVTIGRSARWACAERRLRVEAVIEIKVSPKSGGCNACQLYVDSNIGCIMDWHRLEWHELFDIYYPVPTDKCPGVGRWCLVREEEPDGRLSS